MASRSTSQATEDNADQQASAAARPVSLDQLLSANKAVFDSLFDRQMAAAPPPVAPAAARRTRDDADPVGETPTGEATTNAEVTERASATEQHHDHLAQGEDIRAELNKRFTITWSSEVLEHRVENNRVSVNCRLTVGQDASVESGSSRIGEDGDEQAAFTRAKDRALKKCANRFPTGPQPLIDLAPAPETNVTAHAQRLATNAGPLDVIIVEQVNASLRNLRSEIATVFRYRCAAPDDQDLLTDSVLVTDAHGRMVSGQTGSFLAHFLQSHELKFVPGDIALVSDPYACDGAVSHLNQWLVLMPVFAGDHLTGFVSMAAQVTDAGGAMHGSASAEARSIFDEGLRIAPVKIVKGGMLDQTALALILGNCRTPEQNRINLMALIAACQAGAVQLNRLCRRFGRSLFERACESLRDRSKLIMRELILSQVPQEPQSFEDQLDDDGCGNGPFKLKVTVWREDEHAYFDWTGTCQQASGPINLKLHVGLAKFMIGRYLSASLDPELLSNDGYYDLIHVTLPKGTLLNPSYPAALGWRQDTQLRYFEMLTQSLDQHKPEQMSAASHGTRPVFQYVGTDHNGSAFQFTETLAGGLGGVAKSDGADGLHLWPIGSIKSVEQIENNFPLVIECCASMANTGGAGLHRGGNGIEKIYRLLVAGQISVHDDRHASQPWGVLGGRAGAPSEKWLIRADDTREALPAKCDGVAVAKGDRIVFRTAGAGGHGDPVSRQPALVRRDVLRGLLTPEGAAAYGVVLNAAGQTVEAKASEELRAAMKREHLT